jgi:hypothetical protein
MKSEYKVGDRIGDPRIHQYWCKCKKCDHEYSHIAVPFKWSSDVCRKCEAKESQKTLIQFYIATPLVCLILIGITEGWFGF